MSLVAWYKLDGNAEDSSNNGYHGTNNGVSWVDGKIGGAGSFNGSNSYVLSSTNLGIVGDAEFTISGWVYWDGIFSSDYPSAFGNNSTGTVNRGLSVTFRSGRPALDFWVNRWRSISSIIANEWTHITVVKNRGVIGSTSRIYINGVLQNGEVEGANTVPDIANSPAVIGRLDSNRYFNGLIDDVRIYDHALSTKEIKELAKAKVGHWFRNENYLDMSGYNHHANLFGASLTPDSAIGVGSYEFDGTNDYAIVTDNFITNPDQLTIASWFKKTSTGDNYNCVIHKGTNTSVGGSSYWLGTSAANYVVATIGANTSGLGWESGETNVTCNMNEWYHAVASWDGSTVRVYVNGEFNKEYSLTAYSSINTDTRFGASSNGSNYQFGGVINDTRIYNTALSTEDIKELYQSRANLDDQGNFTAASFNLYNNWNPDFNANNLLENGYHEYENNYNLTGFEYDQTGHYLVRTSGSSTVMTSNFIKIQGNGLDEWDQYFLEGQIKGRDYASRYYYMIICFNKYKQRISNQDVNVRSGTATTLTQDLTVGDEWVYLDDISNWYDNGTTDYHHAKGLAVWRYDDDPIYKPYVYTNRWLRVVEVDKTNNRLRLQNAYSGDVIASGSPAQNHQSGGTYSYIAASNAWTNLDEFEYKSATTSTTPNVGNVRYGTQYIKVGFLINRNSTGGMPTTLVRNLGLYNLDDYQNLDSEFYIPNIDEKGIAKTSHFSTVGIVDGIQAWYPLDGDTNDRSGNENHGVNNGATVVSGHDGQLAYEFDGGSSDSYILIGTPDSLQFSDNSPITVSSWVKPYQFTSRDNIWSKNNNRGSAYTYMFGLIHGNMNAYTGSAWRSASTSSLIQLNEWNHLVFSFDGETIKYYVNGKFVSSRNDFTYSNNTSHTVKVSGYDNGSDFDGKIQDVRIFNRALSAEEIAVLYDMTGGSNEKMKITKDTLHLKGELKEF